MHANTCRNCFKACLCIDKIHVKERRFMDASSKARQVNIPSLPACFLNYISCHPFSCLKNGHVPPVRNISTQERALLSLLSLSRAGTTHATDRMVHCCSVRMRAWVCAAPSSSALVNPGLIIWSLVTQPKGQTISLLITEYLQIPWICSNHPLTP